MHLGDFGQPRVQTILREVFLKHKLAGSFLFDGPAGVGKEALAVEIGRLLNCERDGGCETRGIFQAQPVAANGEACSSCSRFHRLQHPDLHLVFPVPTGFWSESTKPDFKLPATGWRQHDFKSIPEVLAAKALDPYFKPVFDRPLGIQADVLRDIVLPAVHRRPVEARTKVVIVSEAEQMAPGIGNLLLKTLEEPPADCLLVLTSSVSERLLPTIRSRCQRVTFTPLAPEWMAPRLQILHGVDAVEARNAAYLSQGSMLAADRTLSGVLSELRERAFAILLAAAKGDALELLQYAHAAARGFASDRYKFPLLLQLLASIARDTLLLGEGAVEPARSGGKSRAATVKPPAAKTTPPAAETATASVRARLVHEDRVGDLQTLVQAFDAPALRRIVQQTQVAERQMAGYAHSELTLGALFLGLARESHVTRAQTTRA